MYKLITLNIEGDRHLDTVIPFLKLQNADIICLQEVYEPTVSILNSALGNAYATCFDAICLHNNHDITVTPRPIGMAIFSRIAIREQKNHFLFIPDESLILQTMESVRNTTRTLFQMITLDDENKTTVCNTHFTWSPRGEAVENQRVDVDSLLTILKPIPHFIFCGDFNIPRGNVHYQTLSSQLTDHIPSTFATSIDISMHKAKHSPIESERVSKFMVDYIFSKPNTYKVTAVTQHCGVSDHCAYSAYIEKIA